MKQRVEQDDKAYNKMGTETAVATRKEAGPKETMVGRLHKDRNNGQKVDDIEEDESVEEEENEGKECGVAESKKGQDSNLGQFLAKVEDALKPIAIFALSKTAFPARQVSQTRTFFYVLLLGVIADSLICVQFGEQYRVTHPTMTE